MVCLKDTLVSLVSDGIKYAAKAAKNQYPKILAHGEKFQKKVDDAIEESAPAVEKAA